MARITLRELHARRLASMSIDERKRFDTAYRRAASVAEIEDRGGWSPHPVAPSAPIPVAARLVTTAALSRERAPRRESSGSAPSAGCETQPINPARRASG